MPALAAALVGRAAGPLVHPSVETCQQHSCVQLPRPTAVTGRRRRGGRTGHLRGPSQHNARSP